MSSELSQIRYEGPASQLYCLIHQQSHKVFEFHQLSVSILAISLSENLVGNSSFLLELKLKGYFNMTTSKVHIIPALMIRLLFVQELMKDCLQEDSGCFADAFLSAASLFLKID